MRVLTLATNSRQQRKEQQQRLEIYAAASGK